MASALMVQVCGARALPGTIDVGGAGPGPGAHTPAQRAHDATAGRRDPQRAGRSDPGGAGLRRHSGRRRAGRHRAPPPPRRRHPRGRRDRGGGPDRRRGHAADHASRPPRRRRAPDAAPSARAGGWRTRWWAPGCWRSWAGAFSPRTWPIACAWRPTIAAGTPSRSRTRCRRRPRACAPLLLGSLLDAAALNVARGDARPAPVRDGRRVRGRGRRAARRAPARGRADDRGGAGAVVALGAGRAGRLLRRQGRAGRAAGGAAGAVVDPAARPSPSCTPGARRRCTPTASRWAGWASCTRWCAAPGTWRQAAAFELDLDRLAALAAAESAVYRDFAPFPAVPPGPGGGGGRGRGRRAGGRGGARRRRRRAGPRAGVRRLPRAAGGGGPGVAGPVAGVPGRRSHAHRRGGGGRTASGSPPRWPSRWGERSVPTRDRVRRRRLRGRDRRAADRPPPVVRAGGGHRAQRRRPAPGRPVPAPSRAAGAGGARRRAPRRTWMRRWSPTRTGRRPRWWPTLRRRGVRVVDLSADFRLRDREAYESWYGDHGAPELLGGAAYGLPELHRDEVAGADLVAVPGCYPTATLLALAPLARAGAIADVVVDAKSGVSGAGREATQVTHFVSADENVNPYGVDGHRHSAEIDQELAALGADVTATFVPHLVPLDQGELVSCYVTPRREIDAAELSELYEDAYAGEPFVELAARPPGVRDVRETNIARISVHVDPRSGRRAGLCGDRQPVEGRGVPGGPEPEPDVRPRRGGGDLVSFFASRWVPAPRARSRGGRAARGLPRRRGGLRDQAGRRAGPGAAGERRARHHQRRPLHALGCAGGTGAAVPGALRAGRPAGDRRQLGQRQLLDRAARPGRRGPGAGRGGRGGRGAAGAGWRWPPPARSPIELPVDELVAGMAQAQRPAAARR